ncbi:hypothetical protein BpHYR1_040040 [Brachionus plicatilis]|uniref:Uncharacterized protein n=1 Tax=Brachionus plicatilis TaxID=10195 RepID=A0A3M7R522_BRAPC|nr:hypothetical protein BpHYR1_040040 [Brachionus plicatilis]
MLGYFDFPSRFFSACSIITEPEIMMQNTFLMQCFFKPQSVIKPAAIEHHTIFLTPKHLAGNVGVQGHFSHDQAQILIANKLWIRVRQPLGHLAGRFHLHNISVRFQRYNFNAHTIHFSFDHAKIVLFATLIVHNDGGVVSNVSLF